MLHILKYQWWFLHEFQTNRKSQILTNVLLKSRNSPYNNSNNPFSLNVAINSSATNFTYTYSIERSLGLPFTVKVIPDFINELLLTIILCVTSESNSTTNVY
jgi:hypothetical protein